MRIGHEGPRLDDVDHLLGDSFETRRFVSILTGTVAFILIKAIISRGLREKLLMLQHDGFVHAGDLAEHLGRVNIGVARR